MGIFKEYLKKKESGVKLEELLPEDVKNSEENKDMVEFLKEREQIVESVSSEISDVVKDVVEDEVIGKKNRKVRESGILKGDNKGYSDESFSLREVVISNKPMSLVIKEKYYGKRKVSEEHKVDVSQLYAPRIYDRIRVGLEEGKMNFLTRYELVNELYSYMGTRIVTPQGKTEPIDPFPIAIVEIYKQKYHPNKLYVLIPLSLVLSSRDPNFKKVKDKVEPIIDAFISEKYNKSVSYSDQVRVSVFSDVYSHIIERLNRKTLRIPGITYEYLKKVLPLIIDEKLRYYSDFGFGDIEYLFYDDQIEDIFINGAEKPVLAQTRDFYNVETTIYMTNDKLERLAVVIKAIYKRNFSEKSPVIDTQIEGYFNIRVNMTYWSPVFKFSVDGYSLTLRKAREIPPSVSILLHEKFHSINEEVGALLVEFFHRNVGSLIYGETGSGKTTLLKSMLLTVPQHYRIVSLEDTVEMPDMSKWDYHHIRLTAKSQLSASSEDDWTLDKASKNLLRMRPYIAVLGEIRGLEAKTLAEMAQMGLATVYTTLHAKDHITVLNRLIHHMGVEPSAIPSFDTLTLIRTIRPRGTDRIIRRVTSIAYPEVMYDYDKRNIVKLSTGEEEVMVELKEIVSYRFNVDPMTGKISERWDINWQNLFGGKIIQKIHDITGMHPEVVLVEIVEKYNVLRALSKDVNFSDFKAEMERVVKYFNIYNIINNDGYIGEELWNQFVKEMKYNFGINIDVKWDDWIMREISEKEFNDWISVLDI